ncbi:MAG: hypothetical protein ABFR62_01325 [Bacteroidota bacterium]
MKKLIQILFIPILIIGMSLVSCTKDSDVVGGSSDDPEYPREVTDIVPLDFIHKMKANNMHIFKGENPPMIEGTYRISPVVLECSNVEADVAGCAFNDVEVTFSQQDNMHLAVDVSYKCGDVTVTCAEASVIGDEFNFTVFTKITMSVGNSPADYVCSISGEMVNGGISGLYIARFMHDDYGDPLDCLIECGKGRVLYDFDGFSERVSD